MFQVSRLSRRSPSTLAALKWPTLMALGLCALPLAAQTSPAAAAAAAGGAPLASVTVRAAQAGSSAPFDALVEAVRQTVVAAQVPGAVVQLSVKAGDRVAAGQVLLRLDARAAEQSAAASEAQVQAARAALDVAARELERQRRLFQQHYISQAALDQAESQFRATKAQVDAQLAQAGAARTQSGFYVVKAPFAGVVAEVPVSLGDMAMPGRPLLTLYDPAALRVTAAVPQTVAAALPADAPLRIELAQLGQPSIAPTRTQWLPTVDPATHTMQLRADLPPEVKGATPGMYARVWLPLPPQAGATGAAARSLVPQSAVLRRAELTAVYVLGAEGRPLLRLVRLGRASGDQIEVLAGLLPGERVATDPQAAARLAAPAASAAH